ncbi:glycosyltransferase family 2 protein [Enterococcus sp. DIV0170]|uniref:glycosyltransferase family 2 protein n=1 Tax=Enterococcus sp. DIV0170 TaxID=2774642 RepID=UPI003F29E7B4
MISVIIPSYNRENTIERAVESVLNQSEKYEIEILIVDDCSSDCTVEIIKRIMKKDMRIRLFELKENRGANFARNVGIENSYGDIIAFQDSDDEWLEGKLEEQMAFINKGFQFITSSFYKIDGKKKEIITLNSGNKVITQEDILPVNFLSTQTFLMSRKIIEEFRFDVNMPRLQDWDFVLRVMEKYDIFYIDKPYVNQYIQTNSISKNKEKYYEAYKILFENYSKYVSNSKKKMSEFYYHLGKASEGVNELNRDLYVKSLHERFNIRSLVRLFFLFLKYHKN